MKNPRFAPADEVREYLAELMERLDELDEVDYFGPKGWRDMLMNEYIGEYDVNS